MQTSRKERPTLHIIHDHADFPGECLPAEEVIAIILVYFRRRYWIPWGPTHLILGDFLCRHRWIALDAWQIVAKMANDPFVQQHGINAPGHHGRPARTSRAAVRQQIKRMREVLAELIREEGLDLDALDILRSETTSTTVVRYRITIDVIWEHWPRPNDGDAIPVRIPEVHPSGLRVSNPDSFRS